MTGAFSRRFPGDCSSGLQVGTIQSAGWRVDHYLSASEEAELASSAGLAFRHVPAIKSEVFSDRVVDAVGQALTQLESPVLAHCASGVRSAVAWAAAAARSQPADCVLAALKSAGYDLAVLRDELEDQRGRAHPASTPAALDCHCEEHGESVD